MRARRRVWARPCRSWHAWVTRTRPRLGCAEVIGGRGVCGPAQESEGDLQDMVEVRGEGRGDVCIMEVASGVAWACPCSCLCQDEQGVVQAGAWQGSGKDRGHCG